MENEKNKIRLELRRKAEAVLRKNGHNRPYEFAEADQLKLLHEMEVYKIELDLQEEEIDKINQEKEKLTRDYDQLSDLHTRFILHVIKNRKLN